MAPSVAGDLTSVFNFEDPNKSPVQLPSTDGFLPSPFELAGENVNTFVPTQNDVIIGMPEQEKGIRPARALPYELNVHASVNPSTNTVSLTFFNTGTATVVFQVRSGSPADPVRYYTVEPKKKLTGMWNVSAIYDLSVYGPMASCATSRAASAPAAQLSMFSRALKAKIAVQSGGELPTSPPPLPKLPYSMPIQAT